jgi:hypothetical protein
MVTRGGHFHTPALVDSLARSYLCLCGVGLGARHRFTTPDVH